VPGAACKSLAGLLGTPLASAGLSTGDVRAGAATAAKVCGKPFSQAVLDRLGLGAAPPTSGGISQPGGGGVAAAVAAPPASARTGSTTTATARSTRPASASSAPTPAV
jgi:hypothetical protein